MIATPAATAPRQRHRNGYAPTTVETTAGAVTLQRPKVRGTLEKFASRLLGKHVTRTNALESLVISGWVRGLSDRDITATLAQTLGPEATVSQSTVSRICEAIRDEFAAWPTRDLTEVELDYLFVDASHFKMHDGARSEPVLVAYGITTTGNPVFLHLDGVSAEIHRRLRRVPRGHGRSRPVVTGADDLRRGARVVRRPRPGLPGRATSAMPDPPRS